MQTNTNSRHLNDTLINHGEHSSPMQAVNSERAGWTKKKKEFDLQNN